uniref:SAM domain-containing protein n=1 Tax=Trichobilharzia regenti TaxID=157069 RepID=A0AA85KES8_TRIRE|nr:unnamed protein product [Trichobilharzia regenti]
MSNLEASRILESALKDVDAILKVNEINSPEANITENNNFDNHHLPEVPHLDVTDLNTDIVSYEHVGNLDEDYLYKTGKEFSVLIDRLQNCIDKLNHPGPVNASQVTGYGNLDYGITRDHRIRLVRPVTTQITELELSGICKSPPLQSSYSSNGGAVLSDEHFQQRILRLQAQIKAQANLIAKLEKDVNVVPPSKSTCINNNSNRGSHLSINMNNLELLTEVSKQHLRISSLEETNRDLEEKINKLEKELSQRSGYNHLKTSCEDIQSMKFNRQFIGQLPGSCRSIAAGNNNHTNKLNGSLRQLNSVNKVNYSSLRCSANPVVLNDTRFTTALQPEFNSNFVCYSMNGTQSTPPTSRLMYYNPYSYDNCLQSEDMNPNFYPTNHNQLPVIPNQIRSFSLNELRHSRIIQPIGQNNNNNNMRPSVRWDAHNHSGVKSSLTSGQHTYPLRENCHPNTQATAISHLPPQYASSYHQKSYAASRIRSPQPPIQPQTQPTQWIDQRNIFHNNGKQTLTAFSSNEQVSVSSVPCLPCDSPASVKCSTSENVYSSNTPRNHRISSPHLMNSVTHAQQFNEIPQDLGCFLQDDKLTIPAKSASGNHHRLKRIFTDRQYEKGWRSIALLPSPSLTDVKPTSSYTDSSISSSGGDQCQSFRFAYTKRNFCLWDKNMISAWLYRIGLGYTVSNTRRWLNTGQDLVTVSKKSLAQLMGIRNPLHLKKLSIHIHRCMKESSLNNHASLYRSIEAPENFDMTGWLHDIGLSAYIPQFDSCIIDPYVLDQLSMDDLSVLKMSNELHVLSLRWGIQMLRHISFDRNRLCRDHMQQCTANILINRNLLNSPKQSFPTTTDNMKLNSELNGVNHSGMNNAPSINTTITNGNNNNLISGLNASSRPNSVNHETEVFISTYLPIQICYWTQQRVLDWLQSIELPEYAPKLFGSGVHGALMIFEDRFTPDLLADILQISPVKSLVRRHLTHKFIELVGPEIWKRKQENEVNNSLTLNSKIKPSKKKSLFHSTRGHKGNDEVEELVCPVEIDPNHMSIFADEVELNCQIDCNQQLDQESTTAINLNSTNSQPLELQETDI